MLENAIYSAISPEGFASIIYKDIGKAKESAEILKISAQDLLYEGVIDGIIPEYGGATKEHLSDITKDMSLVIDNFIREYHGMSEQSIVEQKLQKFNKF